MSAPFTIRAAVPEDAPAIARVHYESWQTSYAEIMPREVLEARPVDLRTRQWLDVLENHAHEQCLLVAERDGGIVGFANGGAERDGSDLYTGELYAIYLLASAQRGGIGRALTRHIVAWLRDHGHSAMLVWVLEDNQPARAFYQRLGAEYVSQKLLTLAGVPFTEIAYGWRDLQPLLS